MSSTKSSHSSFRIFGLSAILTVVALAAVFFGKGLGGMTAAIILIAVEIAFSFDNAILNAKVLSKMSPWWQTMFLTAGALVAVFGMRVIFPIALVALTADISWSHVLNLALHHPDEYAEKLEQAHPALASFGGAFLLILALDFFVDETQEVIWLTRIEHSLRKLARNWAPPVITLGLVAIISLLPFNHHQKVTAVSGVLGVIVYTAIHGLTALFGKFEKSAEK
ncbi:MAG TPA: DUF475 domain-containing protein, partial [Patescibacteria group bacterium]|nr:DUF475 domain-containing protein [Patescibacteria group bacterium]